MFLKVILHKLNDRINSLSRDEGVRKPDSNGFLDSEVENSKLHNDKLRNDKFCNSELLSTKTLLQISIKPRLKAHWVNENGRLVCKWLCYEDDK